MRVARTQYVPAMTSLLLKVKLCTSFDLKSRGNLENVIIYVFADFFVDGFDACAGVNCRYVVFLGDFNVG